MGVGMKHARDEEPVSLALSMTTESTSSCTTSADSSAAPAPPALANKKARRGRVVATSGKGDFVCKTCSRAFATFQALGGHRTSHLRGRHGLELGVGVGVAKAIREKKRGEEKQQGHECHVCGLGFETGQALGGHMSRHRDEMALNNGAGSGNDQWVLRSVVLLPDETVERHGADRRPVLLELFV